MQVSDIKNSKSLKHYLLSIPGIDKVSVLKDARNISESAKKSRDFCIKVKLPSCHFTQDFLDLVLRTASNCKPKHIKDQEVRLQISDWKEVLNHAQNSNIDIVLNGKNLTSPTYETTSKVQEPPIKEKSTMKPEEQLPSGTKFYKSKQFGWNATTSIKDVKGWDWQITTLKRHGGDIVSIAQAGKSTDIGFTYQVSLAPKLELARSSKRATENNIRELHFEGLNNFETAVEEANLPVPEKATKKIGIGQIIQTLGTGAPDQKVIYKVEDRSFGPMYFWINMETLDLGRSDRVLNIKDRPGSMIGTYYEEGNTIPEDQVNNLLILAKEKEVIDIETRKEKEVQSEQERTEKIEKGKPLVTIPSWAKSVIVADFYIDDSDSMTDYFHAYESKAHRTFLAWSKSPRNNMSELKSAALLFDETKDFVGDPEMEYRQGHHLLPDYYLGSSRWRGWKVHKLNYYDIHSDKAKEEMYIAAAEGRFLIGSVPTKSEVSTIDVEFEKKFFEHTQTGEIIYVAEPTIRVTAQEFKQLKQIARDFKGYYSRYNKGGAIAGFHFKNDRNRESFIEFFSAQTKGIKPSIQQEFETEKPTPPKTTVDKQLADKFFKTADSLQKKANKKYEELEDAPRHTPRYLRMANSKKVDADVMADYAKYYRAIGKAIEQGNLPEILSQISPVASKTHLYIFVPQMARGLGYYEAYRSNEPYFKETEDSAIISGKEIGLNSIEEIQAAYEALQKISSLDPGEQEEKKKQAELEKLIDKWRFTKEPGFFPTPPELAQRLVDEANIQPGNTILEPSAGLGDIAEAIRQSFPENELKVIEYKHSLREILELKGFNVVDSDFLEHTEKYDRIIMNPPFEKDADIIHVRHAYSLLNPGGRLVAIMSEGPFFRSQKRSTEFRDWLDENDGTSEQLPDDSFKKGFVPTSVKTRIVVIDKPEEKLEDVPEENGDNKPKIQDDLKQLEPKSIDLVSYLTDKDNIDWDSFEQISYAQYNIDEPEYQDFNDIILRIKEDGLIPFVVKDEFGVQIDGLKKKDTTTPVTSDKPNNLSQLKKWLNENKGKTLWMVRNNDFSTTQPGKISVVQSNAFAREITKPDGTTADSYLDFQKAAFWSFDEEKFSFSDEYQTLDYYYTEQKKIEETEALAEIEPKTNLPLNRVLKIFPDSTNHAIPYMYWPDKEKWFEYKTDLNPLNEETLIVAKENGISKVKVQLKDRFGIDRIVEFTVEELISPKTPSSYGLKYSVNQMVFYATDNIGSHWLRIFYREDDSGAYFEANFDSGSETKISPHHLLQRASEIYNSEIKRDREESEIITDLIGLTEYLVEASKKEEQKDKKDKIQTMKELSDPTQELKEVIQGFQESTSDKKWKNTNIYSAQKDFFNEFVSQVPELLKDLIYLKKELQLTDKQSFKPYIILEHEHRDKNVEDFFSNLDEPLWNYIPSNIKKTGQPKPLIINPVPSDKNLWKLLDPFIGMDDEKLAMTGIFFDKENDCIVATNAHTLALISEKLNIKSSSIIFDPEESKKDDKYKNLEFPDYKSAIPTEYISTEFNVFKLYKLCKVIKKAGFIKENQGIFIRTKNVEPGEQSKYDISVNADYVGEICKAMLLLGHIHAEMLYDPENKHRAKVFIPKGNSRKIRNLETDLFLLMPIIIDPDDEVHDGNWLYDLQTECIENYKYEHLGCIDVDSDEEVSTEGIDTSKIPTKESLQESLESLEFEKQKEIEELESQIQNEVHAKEETKNELDKEKTRKRMKMKARARSRELELIQKLGNLK